MLRTKMEFICIVVMLLLSGSGVAYSYEVGTHARITLHASLRSDLCNGNQNGKCNESILLDRLGLENSVNQFGETYFDVNGVNVSKRISSEYEIIKNRMPEDIEPHSLEGWLMRGVIREDDLGYYRLPVHGPIGNLPIPKGDDPHDDPYGPFFRVFHHFFDPSKTEPEEQALNLNKSRKLT